MSKKIQHWNGIKKAELRYIPVVCGNCGHEVSIGGAVEDGQIVFEPCPACGAEISGFLQMSSDVESEGALDVSAEVAWFVHGGQLPECKITIAPMKDPITLLVMALDTGIKFFAGKPPSISGYYRKVANFIVANMISLQDAQEVVQTINTRLNAQPDMPTDIDTKQMAGDKTMPDRILKLNVEEESDDG